MSEYIITDKQLGLIQDFANVCVEGEKLPRIVRCRDCKYFECLWVDGYVCTRNKEKLRPWVDLDGFCSWGERKCL